MKKKFTGWVLTWNHLEPHLFVRFFFVLVSFLYPSCNAGIAEANPSNFDTHLSPSLKAELLDGLHGFGLNDGARWQMDAHIGSSFSGMREIFLNSNNLSSDQAGLMGIGAKLQIEINKLIQGCTLQGEGHNQLHAYLTKYIPAVATLSTSGRMKDAQMVGHYLKIYNEYFE